MRPNSRPYRKHVFSLALLLVCLGAVNSMAAQEAARLTQPVDNHARVALPGTVHPLANARNDRGAASPDMRLDRLRINFEAQPATGGEPAAIAA